MYKIKVREEEELRWKARITPHGNEYSIKFELKSDCSMCLPLGICMVLTVAMVKTWIIIKPDVKEAFLKTGEAKRDAYVCPPRESKDRHHSGFYSLQHMDPLIRMQSFSVKPMI